MNYQIILNQYEDNTSKSEEFFELGEGLHRQVINASKCPCRFTVTRKKENLSETITVSADLLYFLVLQIMALKKQEKTEIQHIENAVRKLADAFVRLYKKNGELGQFINMKTDEIIMGGTASAAIGAGALSLAYEYFGEKVYLKTATVLGNDYYEKYLAKGIVNGDQVKFVRHQIVSLLLEC